MTTTKAPRRRKAKDGTPFADFDPLAEMIQLSVAALEHAELVSSDCERDHAEFNGYCSRAADAYRWLAANDTRARELSAYPETTLQRLKDEGSKYGESHYWLRTADGAVLDFIFGPRDREDRTIPYAQGKGASLQRARHDKTVPARKDTQRIIATVQAMLDDEPSPAARL